MHCMAEAICSSDIGDTESEDTSLWDDETTSEENTMENGFHDNDQLCCHTVQF